VQRSKSAEGPIDPSALRAELDAIADEHDPT
jgi:hypothetical protein